MCYVSLCGLCWNQFFGPPLVRSGASCLRMQSALQTTLCTCCGWNIYSVPSHPFFPLQGEGGIAASNGIQTCYLSVLSPLSSPPRYTTSNCFCITDWDSCAFLCAERTGAGLLDLWCPVFVCTERTGAGSPDLYVLCVCLCVQKGQVLVHQIFMSCVCVCVYRKDRCWFTRSLCPVCVFVCTERTGAGLPDLYVLCVCLCVQKGRVLVHQIFDVLPSLNCWSPQDSLSIMRNPGAVTGLFGLGWR